MSKRRSLSELLGDEPPKAKRGRRPGEGGRAATPTRDRLNEAQARLAEIKAATLEGRSLDVDDVRNAWARIALDLRAFYLAVPSRVGARLGYGPAAVAELEAEMRLLIDALAAARGVPGADPG